MCKVKVYYIRLVEQQKMDPYVEIQIIAPATSRKSLLYGVTVTVISGQISEFKVEFTAEIFDFRFGT